mmetsp:Transcript_22084/g.30736  ORF Transcript_22084/g.30736 Transcript_22084/m.30736 type:complete len:267 (+) Transcript_22084:3-803(+)
MIPGLGPSDGVIHIQYRPSKSPSQYKTSLFQDEKPLLLTYFAIKGLGEVPKLMLAECGAHYDQIAVVGLTDQSVAMEWRKRSQNGLLPIMSGLGIPRATPISQSGAIIRFLADRFGMKGKSVHEAAMADVLYETAKDIGSKVETVCSVNPEKDLSNAKEPFALALRVVKMLESMPNPIDGGAALNFGQIQLLYVLMRCEARRSGCVKENLGEFLESFRLTMVNRSGIGSYLKSKSCFPFTKGELGSEGYIYSSGPLRRGDIKSADL